MLFTNDSYMANYQISETIGTRSKLIIVKPVNRLYYAITPPVAGARDVRSLLNKTETLGFTGVL